MGELHIVWRKFFAETYNLHRLRAFVAHEGHFVIENYVQALKWLNQNISFRNKEYCETNTEVQNYTSDRLQKGGLKLKI